MMDEFAQQLLKQALAAGLLTTDAVERVSSALLVPGGSTVDDVAARLVQERVLTSFQAEQLLAGRAEDCVLAGRYQLLESLGAGGMGTVYKAQDTRLNRLVAVKVMAAHLLSDAGAVARFQREARILAQVSHPAIVQAYDSGQDRGRHFLIMEYVPGPSLAQLLAQTGPPAPCLAAEYVYQVALGLQHAHARGVIHRDLKPANLLLTPQRQVKVLDLGLARFAQDQIGAGTLTRDGTGMGTPDYMAPEQFCNARTVDARADVYGLGCTLYHLLTGQAPFPGSSFAEKAQAHEEKEPPALEERCPEAPAGLVLVVRRMMAKRPADRFQTAGELAEALSLYVGASSPVLPRLTHTAAWQGSQIAFTTPKRRPRAGRWAVAAAAVSALLLLLSVLLSRSLNGDRHPDENGASSTPPELADAQPQSSAPNVLSVARDGTGQFRTISEALKRVKPGQCIRVLDNAVYEESLQINDPSRHAGITLEAVRKATIKPPPLAPVGLLVQAVPNVRVRGFRLELGEGQTSFLCGILRKCPGVVFDELQLTSSRRLNTCAISVETIELVGEEPPVLVQGCTLDGFDYGIRVEGLVREKPDRCRGVVVRQNRGFDCGTGIWTSGLITDLHIVANRIWGCANGAVILDGLTEDSSGLLVANNTLQGPGGCLVIREPVAGVQDVVIRNNLLLAKEGPAIVFTGKDQRLLKGWRLDHNWHQAPRPTQGSSLSSHGVRSPRDTVKEAIELLSLDPDNGDFMRPGRSSPLAAAGAAGELPTYIGAVPPVGTEPWDWDRTWRSRGKDNGKRE